MKKSVVILMLLVAVMCFFASRSMARSDLGVLLLPTESTGVTESTETIGMERADKRGNFPCSELGGKQAWPELVGVKPSVARKIIEKENPNVKAIPIRCGAPRTRDLRCDRVWLDILKVPECGNVVCVTPRVG